MLSEKARAARREYQRKWRAANPDRIRKYQQKWRAAHPEYVRECNERYWERKAAAASGSDNKKKE